MAHILKKKLIAIQLIITMLALMSTSIISNALCAPEETQKFIQIPTVTNQNFDNFVVKLVLRIKKDNEEIDRNLGTGFIATDEKGATYLISAGHVFKTALKDLVDYEGTIIIYQRVKLGDEENKNTYFVIPLLDYWKKGLLIFNKDPNIDIGILKYREYTQKEEPVKKELPTNKESAIEEKISEKAEQKNMVFSAINLANADAFVKFGEIEKAGEVLFFGYPQIPGLDGKDKEHILNPIIRKGIISKIIDGKKTIIEGFVSSGSSGSPVFVRQEFTTQNAVNIRLQLVGVVTQYFPSIVPKVVESQSNVENAGLALIESTDNIFDTLKGFDVKKDEQMK